MKRRVECGDCDWTGTEDKLGCDLSGVEMLGERLDPGSEVPAGECPECGSLAYLLETQEQGVKEHSLLKAYEELFEAADTVFVAADDRGETGDKNGPDYEDWGGLRKALAAVRAAKEAGL